MIWILLGCTSGPLRTIELEASCGSQPDAGVDEALWRVDCYRSALDLGSAEGDESLHAAAQAHADYMVLHGELSHEELADNEGFTGEYVWNRAETAGWELSNQEISEVLAKGLGPADAVDLWMGSVYHRAPLVGLDLTHLGFGEAGGYTGLILVGDYPGTEGADVVYPPDGMIGVPVDFDSDSEWPDPAPDHGVVGFPITWSAANISGEADITDADIRLSGPDGEVELLVLQPGEDAWLSDMVAAVPLAPLQPASRYEVELTATVHGQKTSRSVAFETE